jgi:two-component system response regulator FlrC
MVRISVYYVGGTMKDQQKMLEIAALSNIPVLLQGESGAGKEVAARFIHNHGPRRDSPFVALNCSSIPKSLAESILEGSVKGAFTGAVEEKLGLVRSAEGGTLFLDEIGELPLETQSKLLRILQEKAVTPVGAAQSIPVNFRLICATNRNLKMEIADGNFRADLFFRINVFPIEIPPLRARRDFEVVASDLWREARNQAMVRIDGTDDRNHQRNLSTEEMELLKACPWPGNVRQLKNILQRYSVLKPYDVSLTEILTQEFSVPKLYEKNICSIYVTDFLRKRKKKPTLTDIEETLLLCKGNKCKAARKLGISRGSLCYQLQKGRVKIAS